MTDALSQPAGSPFGPDPGRAPANHLLAALPDAEATVLRPDLETVPLAAGQVLYEPRWSLGHVWFPLRGMASLLTPMPPPRAIHRAAIRPEGQDAEGRFVGQSEFAIVQRSVPEGGTAEERSSALEAIGRPSAPLPPAELRSSAASPSGTDRCAIGKGAEGRSMVPRGSDVAEGRQGGAHVEAVAIGPEGMVGLALALGVETAAETAVVRVPGEAARVSAEAFRRAVDRGPGLRRLLARYTLALIGQMAQTGACAWLHEVEQRLANRLVMSQDAVHGAATFPLTHEVAAEMLGVHRPTVSAAAAKLQRAGLIAYARGAVTVLDRPGLDAASCGCHRAVKARFDGLFGGPG